MTTVRITNTTRPIKRVLRKAAHFGLSHYCPVCRSWLRAFTAHGRIERRANARCPICQSVERHRLVWLFFQQGTDLFDGSPKRLLHVAPERAFEARLRQTPGLDYLTADLFKPHVMVKMDITDIQYPDNTFDVIYCSHVLEHVPDDRQAMRELCRVLKSDGWAVLQVPIEAEKTIDDASILDPAERARVFGHPEHVRLYGLDYVERLKEAGFDVQVIQATELVSAREAVRMGIPETEVVHYCRKPQ